MNFFLAAPVFLWGALAAFIPLILHLERRRSARTVPFTMLRFLQEVERKRFLNLRLMELLILLLRMLIMVLIALALASPSITWKGPAPFFAPLLVTERGADQTLVLLDTSYSMSAVGASGTPWEKAKRLLRRTVEHYVGAIPLLVYPFSDGLDRPAPGLAPAPINPAAEHGLEALKPGGDRTDIARTLRELAGRLGDLRDRTLIILTDRQKIAWVGIDSVPRDLLRGSRVLVVDCAEERRPNIWLEGPAAPPLPWALDQEEMFHLHVRSCGLPAGSPVQAQVLLTEPGGRPLQAREIDVQPQTDMVLEWYVRPARSPVFYAGLRVEPAETVHDTLLRDNDEALKVPVLSEVHAALVGGANSLARSMMRLALQPGDSQDPGRSFIRLRIAESIAELPGDLSPLDLIVFQVSPDTVVSGERLDAMEEYVGNGGGLLLILDEIASANASPAEGPAPGDYREILERFGFKPGKVLRFPKPASIVWHDSGHPVFQALPGLPQSALRSVQVHCCLLLNTAPGPLLAISPAPGATDRVPLWRPPLLAEHAIGNGRAICLSTGLDPQSSNLGGSTLFVPLMDVLVKYLVAEKTAMVDAASVRRPESDLTRLNAQEEKNLILAANPAHPRPAAGPEDYSLQFDRAARLSSGLPLERSGGSAALLLLFLALIAALAELWLSNLSL